MAGLEIVRDDRITHNGYYIIHSPSSKWLDWFAIKWRAEKAVEELEQLGDWTKSDKAVRRFGKRKVTAILNKWQF